MALPNSLPESQEASASGLSGQTREFGSTKPKGYWLNKPLHLSINRRLINKNEFNNVDAFVSGFERAEINPQQLAKLIKQGYAYAPVLKGSQRRASNFLASSVLSLDVDGEVDVAAIGNDPLVRQGATIIYTTVSHSLERPRFRIVFALEEPIYDSQQFRAAKQSIALRLFGDKSVVDPSRLFYGNTRAQIEVKDRGLSLGIVEELIAQSIQAVGMDKEGVHGTAVSKLRMSSTQPIRTANRGEMILQEIDPPAAVYCPEHSDENPSAFIVVSRKGQRGIHCSSCAQTFWPNPELESLPSFEVAAKKALKFSLKHQDRGLLTQFEGELLADGTFKPDDSYRDMLPNVHRARVHVLNDRYVDFNGYDLTGVTYVKSPKGTGKTAALAQLLDDPKLKVLVVGHRKALLRQLANRLDLTCYLPGGAKDGGGSKDRFAVSLDSIFKAPQTNNYDYLVIDESEQVLAHFLSDTMVERRRQAMLRLQRFAERAKHVVALDADLGWPTFRFLSRCKGHDQATIILNEVKLGKGGVDVFTSEGQLTNILMEHIQSGLKCYVTSNRKSIIDALHKVIKRDFPSLKTIAITSENSMSEEAQNLLIQPKIAAKFDVILTSPSVSTGVDFSFDDDEGLFHVFGFFEPLTLTHFECDQQLARIRVPISTKVYVDPHEFQYETNLEVVRQDLLQAKLGDSCIKGLSERGLPEGDPEDPLLDLAGAVETIRRMSVNRLLENFVAYKKAEGGMVHLVAPPEDPRVGTSILKLGRELKDEEYVQAILSAAAIEEPEAVKIGEAIKGNLPVPYDEIRAYRRYKIERFYGVPVSRELIELDQRGRKRGEVVLFETVTSPGLWEMCRLTYTRESIDADSMRLLKHRRYRATMLVKILEVAGLADDGALDIAAEIRQAQLGEFTEFMLKHKAILETVFERPLRDDLEGKAIKTLNDFLAYAGLAVTKRRTEGSRGFKSYIYGLDANRIEAMEAISLGRNPKNRKTELAAE